MIHRRILSLGLALLVPAALQAQWVVKSRFIKEESPDAHITLRVDLPVLVGEANPEARRAINHALGQISGVDGLVRDAKRMIQEHQRAQAEKARRKAPAKRKAKTRETSAVDEEPGDGGEDFPDEHRLEFQVGLNDGKLFSLVFDGYWRGGGGAVGNPYAVACIFCASTGRRLEPAELFGSDWNRKIKDAAKSSLRQDPDQLFQDWEAMLPQAEVQCFLKDAKTLVVCFAKYSIAPGAAGVIQADIPLARLKPTIPAGSPVAYLVP